MRSHVHDEPEDLRDFPGRWPDRLADLVGRMLAADPAARPRAAAVVQELIGLEIAALGRRRSA
jgi:hypothetical protein